MKTVLITGASRGIGAACARKFAAEGYRVAINYNRSKAEAEALAAELGGIAVQADVSDPAQVREMVDTVLDKFCQLDILVCNAGVSHVGLLSDMTDEQWRGLFGVNTDGVFHCCRQVIPHFVHRKQGRIVTVSSMWGQVGASCEVAYSAAKAGVIGLTKALAKEVGPSGITVNCITPGLIETSMNQNLAIEDLENIIDETPLCRIGNTNDIASAALFLTSDEASFITGQTLGINGGLVV